MATIKHFQYIFLSRDCFSSNSSNQLLTESHNIQNFSLIIVPCGARIAVQGRIKVQCLTGSISAYGHILFSCIHWISKCGFSSTDGIRSLLCDNCAVQLVCPTPVSFCSLTLEVHSPQSIDRYFSDVSCVSHERGSSSLSTPDAINRLRSLLPTRLVESFDSALQQTGANPAILLLSTLDSPALDWLDNYHPFRGLWRIAPTSTTDCLPFTSGPSALSPGTTPRSETPETLSVSSRDLYDARMGVRFVLLEQPADADACGAHQNTSLPPPLPHFPANTAAVSPRPAPMAPGPRAGLNSWVSGRPPLQQPQQQQSPSRRIQTGPTPLLQQAPSLELNVWVESEQLRDAVREFARDARAWLSEDTGTGTGRQPVLVLAGGKGVGKSTACRYALNTLLNWFPQVAFLDCDVGQTEMTPSGLVSFNIVKRPFFGTSPLFDGKCALVGALSPAHDPGHYLACVRSVLLEPSRSPLSTATFAAAERRMPLVVNTMGWISGLGLMLLVDTFHLVSPSHVVELCGNAKHANFERPIAFENVLAERGWLAEAGSAQPVASALSSEHDGHGSSSYSSTGSGICLTEKHNLQLLPYKHFVVKTTASSTVRGERFGPADQRDLSMLGYLGICFERMRDGDERAAVPRSLNALVPYRVPWDALALHVVHTEPAFDPVPREQYLRVFNAALVALCSVPEAQIEAPLFAEGLRFLKSDKNLLPLDCKGFGVVRAVDRQERVFFLLTPVAPEILQSVNLLVKAGVYMPQCILTQQSDFGSSSAAPYTSSAAENQLPGANRLRDERMHVRVNYSNQRADPE